MRRRTLVVAVALAGIFALAAPAYGQQYPPEELFITVSDTTPTPGQTVTVTAGTFMTGTSVSITFHSVTRFLGEDDDVDETGQTVQNVTIPADATLGTHTITASGTAPSGAPRSLSTNITVVSAGGGAAGGGTGTAATGVGTTGAQRGLPRTGDNSIPLARVGLVTLAVGAGLVFVTRRRRATAAP
jgi:LPXTG-motif cell wall-anchored protein